MDFYDLMNVTREGFDRALDDRDEETVYAVMEREEYREEFAAMVEEYN